MTGRALIAFLKDFQPNVLVNNGDLFDLEALSSYRKTLEARQSVMKDVDAGRRILGEQRDACPHADIVLIEGNHEERVTRYLLDSADALAEVPTLTPSAFLLGDNESNVRYVGPYGAGIEWHGILLYHGARLAPHSGYTARAELGDAGTSGVSGHTHRLGSHYFTDRKATHAWYENGCLCNVSGPRVPPSVRGPRVQNWQQGFSVGFYEAGIWNIYQVSITRHGFVWDGKRYTP